MMRTRNLIFSIAFLYSLVACIAPGSGQVTEDSSAPNATLSLAEKQRDVAERFRRLEALLLRSADLEAAENPSRAALLQQAVQMGKQAQLAESLAQAAESLGRDQLSQALDDQKTSQANLKRLLELLQSENREERIREERDAVRRWIEETDRLLRLQSSLRGRTEGGQDTQQAAGDQGKLSNKASEIAQQLGAEQETDDASPPDEASAETPPEENQNESQQPRPPSDDEERPSSESQSPESDSDSDSESNKSDTKSAGEKPANSKSESGEESSQENSDSPNSSDSAPSQSQSSDEQQSSPRQDQPPVDEPPGEQQQPGQDQSGQQQSGQQQKQQSPTERARERIREAEQRMQEAQEELEKAEREGAIEKQREAERNLREAIEQLEEILRQLREEEIERSLASLETRLRRMLEMQSKVLDETRRLQEISGEGESRQVQIRASQLGLEERKILAEGERAYLLLREEGSSAAFPAAVEQLNTDIANVADRLNGADVGKLTVLVEEDIVRSLEEMVEALVQVQKEKREQQQQQRQADQRPQGEPGDQPLVNKLAELRLIRTLQLRINNRTDALAEMLADPNDDVGQAEERDILTELQGLAERQANIQNVTHDIVIGKGE